MRAMAVSMGILRTNMSSVPWTRVFDTSGTALLL
jgi:hypothetical protein